MTAHWVAPQQSLMMATPDLVMDGLLGGTSRICLLGLGGPGGGVGGGVSCSKRSLQLGQIKEGATYSAWISVSSPEASASAAGTRPSPCPPLAPFKSQRRIQETFREPGNSLLKIPHHHSEALKQDLRGQMVIVVLKTTPANSVP